MVMESDIQFEDIFCIKDWDKSDFKSDIDFQLDMILGIAPLPMDLEEKISEQKIGEAQDLVRKNSIRSQSLDTYIPSCEEEESKVTEQTVNKKTSNHHNFQKHTTTAVRDLVKESQFENLCQDPLKLNLVKKIWRQFLKIKGKSIMTKKFLSTLFKSDIKSVQQLKVYGFKDLMEKHSQAQVLIAKNELKRLVAIFFSDRNIDDHVERRQIKRKEQFRLYLINFRRDLQSSNVKKRISKESSDWISENAKIFDCLN